MHKYTKDGISILITLDARRTKTSGLYPVKVQVVHKRIQRDSPTGKELTHEEWSKLPETDNSMLGHSSRKQPGNYVLI